MKICPQCRTTYTDDTLQFCLQDGNPLENQTATGSWGESETLVSPRRTWEESQISQVIPIPPDPKRSNTGKTVVLTILGTLVIIGLTGFGVWFFLRDKGKEVAQNNNKPVNNTNVNGNKNTSAGNAANVSPSPTVSPKVSPSPSPTLTATPTAPAYDPEQLKSEVSSTITRWNSALRSGNMNSYMSNYADRLDYYYTAKGVDVERVRKDKERAFGRYTDFNTDISNIRVTPDESGNKATVTFDKEWEFEGDESRSEGKVQSQMQLMKVNGIWRITGEKDLKVYYTQ